MMHDGRLIWEILQAQATAAKVQGSSPLRELVMVVAVVILITAEMGIMTVFALAVMEYAVGVSKFGKNPMTLLVHQY